MARPIALSAVLASAAVFAATAGCGDESELAPAMSDCESTHALVGAEAVLETHAHGVEGTARIVDDCSIEISDFHYDGGGLDVRAIVSADPGFGSYQKISEDLREGGPYEGMSLALSLREGMSLDDFSHLSIWCEAVGSSFADGEFTSP